MSTASSWITSIKGLLSIIATVVALTAFVIGTHTTATTAAEDAKANGETLDKVKLEQAGMDKALALAVQSTENIEEDVATIKSDIKQIKALLMRRPLAED